MPEQELDWPSTDFLEIVHRALRMGSNLLTAGELVVIHRMANLSPPALALYSRLTGRKATHFLRARISYPLAITKGADELLENGLLSTQCLSSELLLVLRVSELRLECRAHEVSDKGRKQALIDRLLPLRTKCRWPALCIRHPGLVKRMERWAFFSSRPDRSVWVTDRLGVLSRVSYTVTLCSTLHQNRRALLLWEHALNSSEPEHWIRALSNMEARAPGGLDLRHHLIKRLMLFAQDLEKHSLNDAVHLYATIEQSSVSPLRFAFRHSRCLEKQGHSKKALAVLRSAVAVAPKTPEGLALARAGRRLSKKLKRSFVPPPLLNSPTQRTLQRPMELGSTRPLWSCGTGQQLIEVAAVSWCSEVGRTAVFSEGGLWLTLAALVLGDLYFLPKECTLPVTHLQKPLDWGTPAFGRRRAQELEARFALSLEELQQILHQNDQRFRGCGVVGASWSRYPFVLLEQVAFSTFSHLKALLTYLVCGGHRVASGMPDLFVLSGDPCELPQCFPKRLPTRALFVEIKGPTDTLRDNQRLWHDRLIRMGFAVEVWKIRPQNP